MIHTIADLLQEFVKAEVNLLNQHPNKHPVTVGSMFEGLTEEALNRTVFEGLDLSVVKNSFIKGLKQEFDVLLVVGKGEQIPHTDRYTFEQKQVIAIIQVKKNLFSKDLEEGYDNLKFILRDFKIREPEPFMSRLARDGIRGIIGKDATARSAGELTENEEIIFSMLNMDAFLPVRIIWGFNGFKKEKKLRDSFHSMLEKNRTVDPQHKKGGYGPQNFPNLIICGPYTLIKQNGMPFAIPMKDGWWYALTSSAYNSTYYFLEAIWTRLSYQFNLPMEIFGEDLRMEPSSRFLNCRIQRLGEYVGWEYNYSVLKEQSLKAHKDPGFWEPVELDMEQYVIIQELCEKGKIDLQTDDGIESFVMKGEYDSLKSFLDQLVNTRLVTIENHQLRLLTDLCRTALLPDGRAVAGEDKSGRFTRWMDRFMKEFREQNGDSPNDS